MYIVEMQYMPNLDIAWVERLLPSDEIFRFDTYEEANQKAMDLQGKDPSGRQYRVKEIK